MTKTTAERLKDAHDKGERDCAKDKGYDKPYSTITASIWSDAQAENDAYAKGWNNAWKQK
jgi:hypothetical protein